MMVSRRCNSIVLVRDGTSGTLAVESLAPCLFVSGSSLVSFSRQNGLHWWKQLSCLSLLAQTDGEPPCERQTD